MNQTIKYNRKKLNKSRTPLFKYKKKSLKPISARKQKLKKTRKTHAKTKKISIEVYTFTGDRYKVHINKGSTIYNLKHYITKHHGIQFYKQRFTVIPSEKVMEFTNTFHNKKAEKYIHDKYKNYLRNNYVLKEGETYSLFIEERAIHNDVLGYYMNIYYGAPARAHRRTRLIEYYGEIEDWDVQGVTDLSRGIDQAEGIIPHPHFFTFNKNLNKWDVGAVTNMTGMFKDCTQFNQPLNDWDVSQVILFSRMFSGCERFNQPLDKWDVRKGRSFTRMFGRCKRFNKPLHTWKIGEKHTGFDIHMGSMFSGCVKFNQPLNNWDTSKVFSIDGMFNNCQEFNQPLDKWDVSKCKSLGEVFSHCYEFNQPLNTWDVKQVIEFVGLFEHCKKFNKPLHYWDLSNAEQLNSMFIGCTKFDQSLNNWNVRKVKDMTSMFKYCETFNKPLNKWKVSNVIEMESMFEGCKRFDQPLHSWKIDNLLNAVAMFRDCTSFKQNISNWIFPATNEFEGGWDTVEINPTLHMIKDTPIADIKEYQPTKIHTKKPIKLDEITDFRANSEPYRNNDSYLNNLESDQEYNHWWDA